MTDIMTCPKRRRQNHIIWQEKDRWDNKDQVRSETRRGQFTVLRGCNVELTEDFIRRKGRKFSLHMREPHLLNFSEGISVLPSHNLSCFISLLSYPHSSTTSSIGPCFSTASSLMGPQRKRTTSPSSVVQVPGSPGLHVRPLPILITANNKVTVRST